MLINGCALKIGNIIGVIVKKTRLQWCSQGIGFSEQNKHYMSGSRKKRSAAVNAHGDNKNVAVASNQSGKKSVSKSRAGLSGGGRTASSAANGRFFSLRLHLPLWIMLFVVLWAFLYFFYGDMMLVAEQRGFFSTSALAMQYYSCQPLGWLYVTGRFLLLSCKWPLAGTLLIALMLSAAAWLLDEALRLKGLWHALPLTLPFVYVFYLFYKGLNLVYLREVSWVMSIPLLVFAVCLLLAIIMRVVKKNKIRAPWRLVPLKNNVEVWGLLLWLIVLFCGSIVGAMTYAYNDRLTAAMEVKMFHEDWDGMIRLANKAPHPTRTVAGLRALALNQNGQINSELFNYHYQYPNAHLKRINGDFDGGLDFIVIDCNFSAGLTRAAYHEAMEQNVLEGPSVYRLKRMAQCAIINKENALARKYLDILKTVPFENEFVSKYEPMLDDYNLVLQDPWMTSALELEPLYDTFEQNYREPLFLGYNLARTEGHSVRGLYNSLLAALYTKDMKAFGARIPSLIQSKIMVPQVFEEALVVENIKNLAALQGANISPYVLQTMKNFLGEAFAGPAKDLTPKQKAKRYKQYMGTYEYYYYFQNIPDENYIQPDDKNKKGGVN